MFGHRKYKDLEDFGIIGNLETCGLVGRDGSLDWLCFPYLESPSVFGALLDDTQGGSFRIHPVNKYTAIQDYVRHTNVLLTTFQTMHGVMRLTDFMPVQNKRFPNHRRVYRKLECIQGKGTFTIQFQPRPEYARIVPDLIQQENGIYVDGNQNAFYLQSSIPLQVGKGEAGSIVEIDDGEHAWFVFHYLEDENIPGPLQEGDAEKMRGDVIEYWREWVYHCQENECVIEEIWHNVAVRSGLVLKLLANPNTGAIAAAATTSLPEEIGGVRNWDYRYTWVRDSSFTIQALFHLGQEQEARNYQQWMLKIAMREEDPKTIQVLYSLHPGCDLSERILDHLSGYRKSGPVRVGNGAAWQLQLDIYGELVSALFETTRYGEDLGESVWPSVRRIVDFVCDNWQSPDCGIWEIRTNPRHYVYSKLMCWVALDRGIRIAELKDADAPFERWKETREAIRKALLTEGYNSKMNTFVQAFGTEHLDAANLLIPHSGFLEFNDPKVEGTVEAVLQNLTDKDGLVSRYEASDGLPGKEGKFMLCSFWLIKTLILMGRLEQAEALFRKVLKYVGPLGLLSEEIDPASGKQLGNFPQAFSHIGLVNCAIYIGIAKGREVLGPKPMGTYSKRFNVDLDLIYDGEK